MNKKNTIPKEILCISPLFTLANDLVDKLTRFLCAYINKKLIKSYHDTTVEIKPTTTGYKPIAIPTEILRLLC